MATYVLVHGGWHGGWCWRQVAGRLRVAGHDVLAPTLTGLADRSHLLTRQIDLATHIQDVVSLIEYEELDDVILVGHSSGGMVIAGAADRVGDRLTHLVYLDAFVPENGQALFDLVTPERCEMYRRLAAEQGDGWLLPPPSAAAMGITDPAAARWLEAKLTPHPLACMGQPLRLDHPAGKYRRRFIYCAANREMSSFTPFADRFSRDPAWDYEELDTGHDAMLTMPDELAAALLRLAG